MMQQKNEPKNANKGNMQEKIQPASDIRKKYAALSQHDQAAVVTFFNLHNAAMFVYNDLSKDAQEYCEYCINLSSENVSE